MAEGSIIATIIAVHIAMNMMPAPSSDCPGIRIHIIDIVHPPGMSIPPAIARVDQMVYQTDAMKTADAMRKTPQGREAGAVDAQAGATEVDEPQESGIAVSYREEMLGRDNLR
jgi:hypothetical protein